MRWRGSASSRRVGWACARGRRSRGCAPGGAGQVETHTWPSDDEAAPSGGLEDGRSQTVGRAGQVVGPCGYPTIVNFVLAAEPPSGGGEQGGGGGGSQAEDAAESTLALGRSKGLAEWAKDLNIGARTLMMASNWQEQVLK